MKRQDYQNPTTKVVQLKQRCGILSGSGEKISGSNATLNATYTEETWVEEE